MDIFLLFLIYSLLGCVLENTYYYILHRRYVSKRTLLNLPLCPVYGLACIILSGINAPGDSPILLFCTGFSVVSAVELGFYLISQRLYGIKWWDYSGFKVQLMGGVSLFYSMLWGVGNIFLAKFLDPFLKSGVSVLPYRAKMLAGLFAAVYFWADLKETHLELKKYKKGEKSRITEKFLYLKSNN